MKNAQSKAFKYAAREKHEAFLVNNYVGGRRKQMRAPNTTDTLLQPPQLCRFKNSR
jgi:hypothetical protein